MLTISMLAMLAINFVHQATLCAAVAQHCNRDIHINKGTQ